MSGPRERFIIFSGESVRAILTDRKTQTRRLVNPQPECADEAGRRIIPYSGSAENLTRFLLKYRPYARQGDRLWVREVWRPVERSTNDGWTAIEYKADGAVAKRYWRDAGLAARLAGRDLNLADRRWRSPLFMPRWASRLLLAIDSVRVERLQEISEEDARAEGAHAIMLETANDRMLDEWARVTRSLNPAAAVTNGRAAFAVLWDRLNKDRGAWAESPWVWALSFHVMESKDAR